MSKVFFKNNSNLPNRHYIHQYTQEEEEEFKKCAIDPVYFTKNYVKIITLDDGLHPFDLWKFQEDLIKTYNEERFTICKLPRQVGKTQSTVSYLLWYILFHEDVSVAILANKLPTAREIMSRLQLSFEHLPMFLKQGVREWNKSTIILENGSKAQADSTSGASIRGKSFNIIFLDEFAHVPNNIAQEFFMSTYPTITSGKNTKVIIVSTPKGLNLFYRMWTDSVEGRSSYKPFEVHWSMVPGRDLAWKEETIRNTSPDQFEQEFECQFVGSTNTLIHPAKLRSLVFHDPIRKDMEDNLLIYKEPEKKHTYVITVDVAEGQNLDYSTYSVIDVTSIPYRQVARYRCKTIIPSLFPTVILQAARMYNDAFVLVEINSIGLQVADIIHNEFGYENLIKIQIKGKLGQQHTAGFTKKIALGLKTTHQTKITGCANLKSLIENDKLIINDADTILELTTFSADKKSFKAEDGNHDDMAMTLVHFGWLTAQKYFKENIDSDIRKALQEEQMGVMDNDIVPFGIIDNGLNQDPKYEKDSNGDVWFNADNYPFDDWNWKPRL